MAYTDREDLNYLGQLFLVGKNKTPFWNMIGGLGAAKTYPAFIFPVAQPYSLNSASQNVVTEAASASAGTATTYAKGQDTNTVQIMKYDYAVTFAKQSTYGEISGVAIGGEQNKVLDELDFQRSAAMRQMAIDIEYSFFNGSYQAASDATTAAKTRGLANAISTNEVAAGSVDLSKELLQEMFRNAATNWGENMVIFANALQKQRLSDIYGYAPEDRMIGGVNIKQIETDFGNVGVVYADQVPTDSVFLVNMDVVNAVFCPVDGQLIVDTPTAITAAKRGGFIYTQVGLDYGPEEYHASITGLTTS